MLSETKALQKRTYLLMAACGSVMLLGFMTWWGVLKFVNQWAALLAVDVTSVLVAAFPALVALRMWSKANIESPKMTTVAIFLAMNFGYFVMVSIWGVMVLGRPTPPYLIFCFIAHVFGPPKAALTVFLALRWAKNP